MPPCGPLVAIAAVHWPVCPSVCRPHVSGGPPRCRACERCGRWLEGPDFREVLAVPEASRCWLWVVCFLQPHLLGSLLWFTGKFCVFLWVFSVTNRCQSLANVFLPSCEIALFLNSVTCMSTTDANPLLHSYDEPSHAVFSSPGLGVTC